MTTTRSWTLTPSPASASRARWSWERASARSLQDEDTSPAAVITRHRTQAHRDWLRAAEERARLRATWQRFFTNHDVLITPAAPTAAIPAGSRTLHVDGQERPFFHQAAWTTLTSHVGLPTLITPIATTKQGLPIAVQLVGAPYRDRTLLALAEQLAAAVDREPAPYGD